MGLSSPINTASCLLSLSLNRPPARSPGRTAGKCAFVDLTRTSLFFHPTERIKGDNGRHQDPPPTPSRPTARTRYPEASRPPEEASGRPAGHSALRPPPCNLTGTTGYDKPPHFLARRQPPACFRRTVRFPLFSTCGRGTTNISHLAVSNPGMSFPRSPVDLHSRGHVVYTCINVQIDRRSLLIMTWTWDFEFPPITWRQLAAGLLSPSLSLETLIMESNSTFPALPEPRRVES